MPFETLVAAFADSLTRRDLAPADFALGRQGLPDTRRFRVYRNNVAAGLIGALEDRYPVARRLVGDDFFRGMSGAYVAVAKPASAVMIHYGVDFPEFVADFEPARALPYLADVARLENAWVEAYHAGEGQALTLAHLAAVPPQRFADLVFTLHPSVRLLRLAHSAASIWAAHQHPGEPDPPERWQTECAMALRPDAEVEIRVLPEAGFALALRLRDGMTLGEAAASGETSDADVGSHLIGLISAGAIVGMKLADPA